MVQLTPKIAPNDLKTKITKVKADLESEKRISKVFVEVVCSPNQMDQANALLLSVQRMFEGLIIPSGKPIVRKSNPHDDSTELMDEEEVLEAMESPEEFDQKTKGEKKTPDTQITVTFRQEYSNPAYNIQLKKEKQESKDKKDSKESDLHLSEEDIKMMVAREFTKFTARSAGEVEMVTDPREDLNVKMEKMFQVSDHIDFEADVGFANKIKLNPAWVNRMIAKMERAELMEKGLILPKAKERDPRKSKQSKLLKQLIPRTIKLSKRPVEKFSGMLLDPGLYERNEEFTRTDPQTKKKILTQTEILKKI